MVPDRNDNTPAVDDDDENGVLADTGSIDTTAIGIFGSTAHVSVSMPVGSADDDLDADDDVDIVADEIAVDDLAVEAASAAAAIDAGSAGEAPAEAPAELEVIEAEIVIEDVVEAEVVGEEYIEEPVADAHVDAESHLDAESHVDAESHDSAGTDDDAEWRETADEPRVPDAEVAEAEQSSVEAGEDDVSPAPVDPEGTHSAEEAVTEAAHVIDGADDENDGSAQGGSEHVEPEHIAPEHIEPEEGDIEDVESVEDDIEIVVEDVEAEDKADHEGVAAEDAMNAYAAFAAAGFDVRGLGLDDFDGEVEDETDAEDEDEVTGDVDGGSAHTGEIVTGEIVTGEIVVDEIVVDVTGGNDEGAAVDEVKPVTDPLTRSAIRQAMADEVRPGDAAEHPRDMERVHETERIAVVRPEVALTSKRYGEFEPGRESADLLTPDRLLDHSKVGRSEPEGTWQQFVYSISGKRINLGDSKRARARKELDHRIAAPLTGGARFVPVLSRKGGVGKTTITTLLGMALADARDDRVIAIDGNPDRGTLAERISRPSGRTVRDLARVRDSVTGYNDISSIVARDETRLDVIASDADPHVSEAFSDDDYRDVASIAAHYYSLVLTDTGTGIVHSVMGATLDMADQIVIVSGLAVDEARLASETLTWLETNGFADKVRKAVVVLNNARPGAPLVLPDELEAHFRSRVRAVVRMPYDPHIGAGSAIVFRDLQPATREAARQLAAIVIEGLRSLDAAA